MRINFEKICLCDERLDELVVMLESSMENMSHIQLVLSENDMLPQIREDLKIIIGKMDSQIYTTKKMQLALEKTRDIFILGEQRLSSAIEGDISVKSGFVSRITIPDNTAIEWSIR